MTATLTAPSTVYDDGTIDVTVVMKRVRPGDDIYFITVDTDPPHHVHLTTLPSAGENRFVYTPSTSVYQSLHDEMGCLFWVFWVAIAAGIIWGIAS
jgi:hypothetical protein